MDLVISHLCRVDMPLTKIRTSHELDLDELMIGYRKVIRQKWDWNDFLFTPMCIDQQLKRGHVFPTKLIVTIDQMFRSVSRVMFTNAIRQSLCLCIYDDTVFMSAENILPTTKTSASFTFVWLLRFLFRNSSISTQKAMFFCCRSRNASANFSAIYLQFEIRARGSSQVGDEIYMQIASFSTYRNE